MDPVVQLYGVIFIALLISGAALHKLRHPDTVLQSLIDYGFSGFMVTKTAVKTIAFCEGLIVVCLVFLSSFALGLIAAAVLFSLYGLMMAFALYKGRQITDCGCGWGGYSVPVSGQLIGRNIILASASLIMLLQAKPRDLNLMDHVNGLFFVAAILTFYYFFEIWVAVRHRSQLGKI